MVTTKPTLYPTAVDVKTAAECISYRYMSGQYLIAFTSIILCGQCCLWYYNEAKLCVKFSHENDQKLSSLNAINVVNFITF